MYNVIPWPGQMCVQCDSVARTDVCTMWFRGYDRCVCNV